MSDPRLLDLVRKVTPSGVVVWVKPDADPIDVRPLPPPDPVLAAQIDRMRDTVKPKS